MVLFDGVTLFCGTAEGSILMVETKVEERSALLEGKKEVMLSFMDEKGDGEGVLLVGGAGPETSLEGGEEAVLVPSIVLG